jgi:hypothetical protein
MAPMEGPETLPVVCFGGAAVIRVADIFDLLMRPEEH